MKFSLINGSNGLGQVPVSLGGVSGDSSTGYSVFVPSWDLCNDSRLSVRANALEFSRHALPPAVVGDMDAMSNPALVHNMAYAATQTMFYLVAGSRRVHALGEMEAIHAACESRVTGLERRLGELGKDLNLSDQSVNCWLLRRPSLMKLGPLWRLRLTPLLKGMKV